MPRKTGGAGQVRAEGAHRFNEAAARCRGKPGGGKTRMMLRIAGFNEAAARCRGKQRIPLGRRRRGSRFNEAAARCRGKHREDLVNNIEIGPLQ